MIRHNSSAVQALISYQYRNSHYENKMRWYANSHIFIMVFHLPWNSSDSWVWVGYGCCEIHSEKQNLYHWEIVLVNQYFIKNLSQKNTIQIENLSQSLLCFFIFTIIWSFASLTYPSWLSQNTLGNLAAVYFRIIQQCENGQGSATAWSSRSRLTLVPGPTHYSPMKIFLKRYGISIRCSLFRVVINYIFINFLSHWFR